MIKKLIFSLCLIHSLWWIFFLNICNYDNNLYAGLWYEIIGKILAINLISIPVILLVLLFVPFNFYLDFIHQPEKV